MLVVEKPYLEGFAEGYLRSARAFEKRLLDDDHVHHAPFVLLALNGGDEPLTVEVQEKVAVLRSVGLRRVF